MSELSQLGQSSGQIVAKSDALANAGVPFVAVTDAIRGGGIHRVPRQMSRAA